MHRISKYVSITFKPIKYGVGKPVTMILRPMVSGVALSATVLGVLSISNGLSTYIFNGETLESKVKAKLGGQ